MTITIKDQALRSAAEEGMDAFIGLIGKSIADAAGGELNAESMQHLTPNQITLWGYLLLRDELMDGALYS